MSKRFEGSLKGSSNNEIFFQTWEPDEAEGTIFVTHGLGEHSEAYHDFAQTLGAAGWRVFAWDLPGHGRSEGKRGYVPHFSKFIHDWKLCYEHTLKEYGADPLVLLGHSMGGLILSLSLIDYPDAKAQAVVLSAPAFGLAMQVPAWKEKLSRLAGTYLSKITLSNEISYDDLVRDETVIKRYESDPLRHDKVSPLLFMGMLEGFQKVGARAQEITLPLLMQLPGEEKVVSTPKSKELFESFGAKDKELFIYGDSYHEVYNDLDRDEALNDLLNFIRERK